MAKSEVGQYSRAVYAFRDTEHFVRHCFNTSVNETGRTLTFGTALYYKRP